VTRSGTIAALASTSVSAPAKPGASVCWREHGDQPLCDGDLGDVDDQWVESGRPSPEDPHMALRQVWRPGRDRFGGKRDQSPARRSARDSSEVANDRRSCSVGRNINPTVSQCAPSVGGYLRLTSCCQSNSVGPAAGASGRNRTVGRPTRAFPTISRYGVRAELRSGPRRSARCSTLRRSPRPRRRSPPGAGGWRPVGRSIGERVPNDCSRRKSFSQRACSSRGFSTSTATFLPPAGVACSCSHEVVAGRQRACLDRWSRGLNLPRFRGGNAVVELNERSSARRPRLWRAPSLRASARSA
jgi:hypothetical protein